jgi:hypothetical protein
MQPRIKVIFEYEDGTAIEIVRKPSCLTHRNEVNNER